MIKLDESPQWYAVRTRTKSEKWVINQLHEKGVEGWIPLKWSVKRYPGRVRKTQIPLIRGYAFVRINQEQYIRVLEADGVFGFVKFDNEIPVIPESQIELLKFITGENIEVVMTEDILEPGDQVEIIGGELTGVSGELVEFKGKNRVMMRIDKVGLSFLIDVPRARLRIKS